MTAKWEFEIPTEFLCHVEWAQELIKNETKKIECLIFMSNSYTLRLVDPEEDSLRGKISDAGGFGAEVRLSPNCTLSYCQMLCMEASGGDLILPDSVNEFHISDDFTQAAVAL